MYRRIYTDWDTGIADRWLGIADRIALGYTDGC